MDIPFWRQLRISQRFSLESHGCVLSLYMGLTVLMTFPLVLSWRSALPAGSADIWQNYWNFWWWKQCLLGAQNPLHTKFLFHPFGTDLVFHTHSFFNQIIGMPVNLLFGEAAAYNFCLFFALTLSGFGTYLLVRELTFSASAGFLAGLIFAYFPQTLEQAMEHLNLFSLQFIPLSMFYLLRWSRSMRIADVLAFGICCGLNALCSWHLGLKLALLLLPWFIWILVRSEGRRLDVLHGGMFAAIAFFLLILPVVTPMIQLIADGADYYIKPPVARGIDPTYLLTPPFANPLFGHWVQPRFLDRAYQAAGFLCYLGVVPLCLAGIAVFRNKLHSSAWVLVFCISLVLSLGANLYWDGTLITSISLPFAWLKHFLILENLRVANRFLIFTGLALAVLAGIGWSRIRRKKIWVLPLVSTLLLLEYSWFPYPVKKVEISPLIERITERPGAVLDLPFHQRSRAVHNMVTQTVHQKPISGGYLSSYPPATLHAVENESVLQVLSGAIKPGQVIDVQRLRYLGFQTVIVHKYRLNSVRKQLKDNLSPDDLMERKRINRYGGIPDSVMNELRTQLDKAVGAARFEDELVAIYFL